MERIKIGLIGTGHSHAAGKLQVLRNSPEFEVIGVVEPNERHAAAARNSPAFAGIPLLTEVQLLETPGLKAVVVETEVPDLLPAAQRVIAADKHLHLEKPGGASLPQFRALLDNAARKHLVVQLGYMYRYNPGMVLLREALSAGYLGDVFEIHAVMSKVVNSAGRRECAAFSGGMMFELGCHLIDLVIGLLGRPTQVTPYRQHVAPIDDQLADNTLAVLEYPKALVTVKSSGLEVDGGARRHIAVCGTAGTCHVQPLDEPTVRLTLAKKCGKYRQGMQEIVCGDYPRYVGDMADLAKILRSEKESDFSYEHELAVLETTLKAARMPIDR